MSSQRDRQFPATSIGRSAGPRVQQQAAIHDAHPLLAPGSSSPPGTTDTSANGAPKYLPYTPRQRVAAAATTTGTIVHPPPSPQHQGNATTKLQLMHLKAAAQNLGLDTSTFGWAILEKLVAFNDGEDWHEIWTLITSGKATLLLPLEQISTNESLTSEVIRDHIIIWDNSSGRKNDVVTSSGLRGILDNELLTLRSTISPTSKLFQDLISPITRSTALSLLPPLPDIPESAAYPRITISSDSTILPLPPRAPAQKPPLPPRPTGRSTSVASGSRIPNPFASLFGGAAAKVTSPTGPNPTSPPASIRSFDSSQDSSVPVDVSVFTIDRKIVRHDIAKEVNKALKHEIKSVLASCSSSDPTREAFPLPNWVVDRLNDFTADWFPFVKIKTKNRRAGDKDAANGFEKAGSRDREYEVNRLEESSDDAADRVQEFLMLLEQDLRAAGTPFVHKNNRASEKGSPQSDLERERERLKEALRVETRIREVMEVVERIISSLFYERLFMQPSTDDASHDETLTSRIAALNMLDLSLAHLDVLVGDNGPDVEVVVKACGEMLSQLDPCRCPGDKASILVAAHKVVVDGLSRLPPIRLKSDTADEDLKTAKPSTLETPKRHPSPPAYTQDLAQALPTQNPPPSESQVPANQKLAGPTDGKPSPLLLPATNLPDTNTTPELTLETHANDIQQDEKGKLEPHPPATAQDTEKKRPAQLTLDRAKEPTPVSGDILLPMLIFSVVKANPPRLLSNLLFTQRFRNQGVGGEESYCLINLMAVAEFLENVDLEALGLSDSTKVMSAADLTPIPLARSPVTAETPLVPGETGAGGLRGRMEQQVDAIADSANKVISGVVDSSFGILRSFLPQQGAPGATAATGQHGGGGAGAGSRPATPGLAAAAPPGSNEAAGGSSWKSPRPGFGLLRRESGFSIASIAASLPIAGRNRSSTMNTEELGQQLVTVSRPGSVRSRASLKIRVEGDSSQDEDEDDEDEDESESVTTTTDEDGDGEEGAVKGAETGSGDEGDEEEEQHETQSAAGDARSIKSIESMMASGRKSRNRKKKGKKGKETLARDFPSATPIPVNANNGRTSLSDRLARVSNLAASLKDSRNNSLLLQPPSGPQSARRLTSESPGSSRSPSPTPQSPVIRLAPPIQRFVDCNPGDLRLSEIGELLRDYRRIVEGVRAAGGFDE